MEDPLISYLLSLPDQVLLEEVLPRLPTETINNLCRLQTRFSYICIDDNFWHSKVNIDFPGRNYLKSPLMTWREFYMSLYRDVPVYCRGVIIANVKVVYCNDPNIYRTIRVEDPFTVVALDQNSNIITSVKSDDYQLHPLPNNYQEIVKVNIVDVYGFISEGGNFNIINDGTNFQCNTLLLQTVLGIMRWLQLNPIRKIDINLSDQEIRNELMLSGYFGFDVNQYSSEQLKFYFKWLVNVRENNMSKANLCKIIQDYLELIDNLIPIKIKNS
jgi:hypothetical protein